MFLAKGAEFQNKKNIIQGMIISKKKKTKFTVTMLSFKYKI